MTVTPGEIPSADGEVFLVGDLRVDVGQQRVTRAGVDITLPNLSFELLLALIRVAPNLISNELLMARVWPGQIVSPETIAKRVNLLRTALGDSAQEPRYIAGVRGRGYRLVAHVSPVVRSARSAGESGSAPQPPAPPDELSIPDSVTPEADTPAARPRRAWWVVLSVLVVVVVAIVITVRTIHGARSAGIQPHLEDDTGSASARTRTVAVLPFDNISADPADAFLAQGIPEMILNRLSRIEGLSVIARNSSFALSTRSIDSSEIGRRLNSGYLVGGSVQREADRLRVAVHLVDSAAGTQIWSAHFDRGLHDIFRIEDEIADQLADALSVQLGVGAPKPRADTKSANVEAYLAYLQGRTLLGRFSVAESEAAMPYFERAIALDPTFAPAYASLYDAKMQAADQRRDDMTAARQRNRHLIDRALQLDPELGAAYFARAMWANQPFDASATADNPLLVAREADFRRGAALDPSNGRGLTAFADFLAFQLARPEEGKGVSRRALWVDPMSPGAHFTDAGLSDPGAKEWQQKILQILELDPNFVPALLWYGKLTWLLDGKFAEAIQVIEHGIALDPENSLLRHAAMVVYLDLGDPQAARAVVSGMPESARERGLLSMYEGDWRRAGHSAYDETVWARDGDTCEIWQSRALRDYALRTGELRRAIAFMKLKYYFGDLSAPHMDVCNCIAAVHISQVLAADGQARQAEALRRIASSWIDANEAKYLGGFPRTRAEILLLEGKRDAALTQLAAAFRARDYVEWWYTLNLDPLWLPLHGDERFEAIAADVRRYVDGQHGQVEALRQRGALPRRGDPAAAH